MTLDPINAWGELDVKLSQINRDRSARGGFTLLELMLALALIVVATAIIGSLMQMYASNFATRGEDIRRAQVARSILTMMAEDIRGVVMEQAYDPSVLEQLMGAQGGGGGGGGGTGGAGAATGGEDPSGAGASATSGLSGSDPAATSEMADLQSMTTATLKPGIYGTQFQLMVDVSRVPRPDESIRLQQSLMSTEMVDIPGDIKTVTYYVQSPTQMGVQDSISAFGAVTEEDGYSAGLVRRQLDRAVTAYAEEMGNTQRLMTTGDLLAPEVVSLEFAYFDGTQWLTQWDSSTQSLPWLVQISLAMQSATGQRNGKIEPGTGLSSLSLADRQTYGVEVYELVVAIPGAQLRAAADAAAQEQAAGMEAMGL